LAEFPVTSLRRVGGEHGISHAIGTLPDGGTAFIKSGSAPAGAFEAEANGLRWLRVDAGAPVPAVLGVDDAYLAIEYLPPERPSAATAERFGAELAATHAAGPPEFGAPWPGWIAGLPLDNTR
jgi:fructosamine-3-kinase